MNLNKLKCLVVDTGLFLHIARRLGRDFGTTWYWSPWETAFPRFKDDIIGMGYNEIIPVESVEEVENQVDLVVFPDIGYSGLQKRFIAKGIPVWGCRDADELESRRGKFLEVLEQRTNLPVPPHEKIKGLSNLRLFLKEHNDQYIKVSTYRGDFETFHFRNMAMDENVLDEWSFNLGPLKEIITFWVFAAINTQIEDGCDTYCIDGQWPSIVLHGMEHKDKSFLGAFQKFSDLPQEIRSVNEQFSPVLKEYGYRSWFSTEVRITDDDKNYFIDPTCRAPSPPSQMLCEMTGNFSDIIWQGANGVLIDPEPESKFGVQAVFKLDRSHWKVLEIPAQIERFVKVSFSCKVNDRICVPPDPEGIQEIGWCVGIGDTMENAIKHLRSVVEQMPDGVHVEFDSLATLLKETEAARNEGIEFTDQPVPEPASVIEE